MQKVHTVTDINIPITQSTSISGSIALRDLYLVPGWKRPKSNILFSYQKKNHEGKVYQVLIESGKTYTFSDFQDLLREHLDTSHTAIFNIFYNAGRVTLMVNIKNDPAFNYEKIKLCDELLEVLGLPQKDDYTGITPGKPVDYDSIKLTFITTDLLYFRCKQITGSYQDGKESTNMAVVQSGLYRDPHPLYYKLTENGSLYRLDFSIEDQDGNKLPFKKSCFTVVINDEL